MKKKNTPVVEEQDISQALAGPRRIIGQNVLPA